MSQNPNSNDWINNFARLNKSQKGNNYIEVTKDVNLQKGDRINLKKFEDHLKGLVGAGVIQSDEADRKLDKQGFVKYILSRTPREKLSE